MLPSSLNSTCGARSIHFFGMRVVQRSGGSIKWLSTSMTRVVRGLAVKVMFLHSVRDDWFR